MQLSLAERFALLQILPTEGDYVNLRIWWTARLVLAPTGEEIKEYDIQQEAAGVRWSPKAKDYLANVPLTDAQITLIRQKLTELDKSKKLTQQSFPLYEKFVLNYQQL